MLYIKKTITEAAGLPKEITLNLPLITLWGKDEILIENHKGLALAEDFLFKIKSSLGIIEITGKNLYLKEISPDFIRLTGSLEKLEFLI